MKNILTKDLIAQPITNYYIILGGSKDTPETEFNTTADSFLAKHIPSTDISLIVDMNQWESGKRYNRWSSTTTQNYYIYNSDLRIVYLLIDNLQNGRADQETLISTILPSHTTPTVEQTSDGLRWIPLYSVDILQDKFITKTNLPILDVKKEISYTSFTEKYRKLCSSGITVFGSCCLYYKQPFLDEVTGKTFAAGTITNDIIFSNCYDCQKIAESLGYEPRFLSGYTAGSIGSSTGPNQLCDKTITIKTIKQQLENDKFELIPGSATFYQKYCLDNFTNPGGIVRAEINLSGLSESDISINQANPLLQLKSPVGSGAQIRVLTEQKTETQYLINGIQVEAVGSGYDGDVLDWSIPGAVGTTLMNAITLITLPNNDAFYENPQIIIPAKRTSINTKVAVSDVNSNIIVNNIKKWAIAKDLKDFQTGAIAQQPANTSTFFNLQTTVRAVTGPVYEF